MKRTSAAIALSFALWISLTAGFAYVLPKRPPDPALRETVDVLRIVMTAIMVLYALGSVHLLQRSARRHGLPNFSVKDVPGIVNGCSLNGGSHFEYLVIVLYVALQIIVALWVTSIWMGAALNIYALLFQ